MPIREARLIRCSLVHDLVLLRQGLRRLLEDQPDFTVVAEAGNAAVGLQHVSQYRPDVMIAGTHLFAGSREPADEQIYRVCPLTKALFLHSEAELISDENHAGRNLTSEKLIMMVRSISGKDADYGRAAAEARVAELVPRNRALTAREREVLKLLAEGGTVRSVAGILGLSMKTVDAHKFNLMRKLGIHNKAELVMWAIQQRILKVPVNF